MSDDIDTRLDRQYRTGFMAGWNAGVSGDEETKRKVENRLSESSASPAGYPACPHCGQLLKLLRKWDFDMGRPAGGFLCSCEHCGGGLHVTPTSGYEVKAG